MVEGDMRRGEQRQPGGVAGALRRSELTPRFACPLRSLSTDQKGRGLQAVPDAPGGRAERMTVDCRFYIGPRALPNGEIAGIGHQRPADGEPCRQPQLGETIEETNDAIDRRVGVDWRRAIRWRREQRLHPTTQ